MARKALEKLRSIYSAWTVPPEPMDSPLATGWSWMEILKGILQIAYTAWSIWFELVQRLLIVNGIRLVMVANDLI